MSKKPSLSQNRSNLPRKSSPNSSEINESERNIVDTINQTLKSLKDSSKSLKDYPIQQLVQHSEDFGRSLKNQKLETNQIRKFLDAINRIKFKITQLKGKRIEGKRISADAIFESIKEDIILLKPKLAYAAGRKEGAKRREEEPEPAKQLCEVISNAIDNIDNAKSGSLDDFNRLAQLIESIIAYHKAEGGK